MVHSLCVWSINVEDIAVAAHLVLKRGMYVNLSVHLQQQGNCVYMTMLRTC